MSNEEAIEYANCLKNNYTIDFDAMEEFCNIAIKAIKKISDIDRIINSPIYIQEDVFRYKAICEAIKGD